MSKWCEMTLRISFIPCFQTKVSVRISTPIATEIRNRLLFGPPMSGDIDKVEPEKEPPAVRRHQSR